MPDDGKHGRRRAVLYNNVREGVAGARNGVITNRHPYSSPRITIRFHDGNGVTLDLPPKQEGSEGLAATVNDFNATPGNPSGNRCSGISGARQVEAKRVWERRRQLGNPAGPSNHVTAGNSLRRHLRGATAGDASDHKKQDASRHLAGPSNGSRLSCGRNARGRKELESQTTRFASEATQFFPTCERPPASSAC